MHKSLVNEHPPRFPSRAPMERDACLQSLLYISFWIPSKGALPPPGSPNRAPAERDVPFPEPSFNYLLKFPVNGPTRFPNGAPMDRGTPFQSLLLHIPC